MGGVWASAGGRGYGGLPARPAAAETVPGPAAEPATPGPSPLLGWPGAVPAEDADAGVACHYGDPAGEQRTVSDGAGLLDRSNRTVIMVRGTDRLSWLERVASQRLSDLPDRQTRQALVLTDDGYVRHHFYVTELGEAAWITTGPRLGAPLLDLLAGRAGQVTVRDEIGEWATLAMIGPRVPDVLAAVGAAYPPRNAVGSLAGGGWLWGLPYPGADRVAIIVPRGLLVRAVERLVQAGARLVGTAVNNALRVASCSPRIWVDTDEHTLPQEVGWAEVAVCMEREFRGRAAVERVSAAGGPPRRLVRLRLAGDLPEFRDPVTVDGRRVGFVGTVARHVRLGPVALALVESAIPDRAEVLAGGLPATVDPPAASVPVGRGGTA